MAANAPPIPTVASLCPTMDQARGYSRMGFEQRDGRDRVTAAVGQGRRLRMDQARTRMDRAAVIMAGGEKARQRRRLWCS